MVIDLDDDDDDIAPAAKHEQAPAAEFEEYEDEVDPSAPYRDVLRYIDIPLGSAALRVAVPHIPKDLGLAPIDSWPSIYLDRIVVAVACADSSIRVVSAPLDPPSPEVKDVSKLDMQMVRIFGPNSHPEFIFDITVTHTATVLGDVEDNDAQPQSRNEVNSQSKQKSTESDTPRWSLLVASISCTGSGLLLVHQIPLQSNNALSTETHYLEPIRRQYLTSPSMSAKLAFNTTLYPADRHSTLLITLPAASCVKLYQVLQTYTRGRRGSAATVDTVSSNRSLRTTGDSRGRFLITFLPSFVQDNDAAVPRRKRVLDAQWIAGGRAVIALLEDGEWGIWDLEAVGPTSSSAGSNLIRGQGNISGIQGGSLTLFAVRSNIFPTAERKQPKPANSGQQPTTGSLVPMTPSTRKTRSEDLFHGQTGGDSSTTRPHSLQGSLHVEDKPSNRGHDETVVISYADGHVYIPSILSFWKSEAKPTRLPAVRYGGQQPRGIGLLPKASSDKSDSPGLFGIASSTPNFLVQTDHRLILSLSPLPEAPTNDASTQTQASGPLPTSDQALLAAGDLDVDGMDRILQDMDAGGPFKSNKPMNLFTKSVGFRIDEDKADDEDVDMGSPTPARYSRRILGSAPGGPVSQRRVFT